MKIFNFGVLKAWQNWVFVALVVLAVAYGGFLFNQAFQANSED